MTKTLLVPLDGSEAALRALPVAGRLSSLLDADVVLVAAELPGSAEPPAPEWLAGVAPKVGVRGARIEIVQSVAVADALAALAGQMLDPAVCMATHARTAIGRAWFGSVAEDVVRSLEIPIVLVGPRHDVEWRAHGPIVVAVDGSVAALDALGTAIEWDRSLHRGITMVHVAHPLDVELVPDLVLEAAQRRFPDVTMQASILRSREPEWEIVDLARGLDASMIVCSTHRRTGVGRLVLGSVAMGVVHRSSCPVLVQRPVARSLDDADAPSSHAHPGVVMAADTEAGAR